MQEIAGVDDSNPLSYEPFQADYKKLFFGKAMLILQTKEGQSESIRVIAERDGLKSAEVTVKSKELLFTNNVRLSKKRPVK